MENIRDHVCQDLVVVVPVDNDAPLVQVQDEKDSQAAAEEVEQHDAVVIDAFQSYDVNRNSRIEIDELSACMKDLGLLKGRSEGESRDIVVATFAGLDSGKKNYLNLDEFSEFWKKAKAPKLKDVVFQESPELGRGLYDAFLQWCMFGSGSTPRPTGESPSSRARKKNAEIMGSSHWMKLCRDTGLIGKKNGIPSTECDLVFAKVKTRGARKISFAQFMDALGIVASKLDTTIIDVARRIVEKNGPSVNGTVVSTPRFLPQSSPRVTPTANTTASIFKNDNSISKKTKKGTSEPQGSPMIRASSTSQDVEAPRAHEMEFNSEQLLHVYGQYARFGQGRRSSFGNGKDDATPSLKLPMDSKQFCKLCRECGLTSKKINSVKIDLIFTKARSSKQLSLHFEDFLVALSMIAGEEGVDESEMYARVCKSTGPQLNLSCSSPSPTNNNNNNYVRLHDDPRTQCGVYGRRRQSM